jgi:hypothetical protein
VNATEADVLLTVVGGQARYGDADAMTAAKASPAGNLTVAGVKRKLAIADPKNKSKAWQWSDIVARLEAVRKNPAGALKKANAQRRDYAGSLIAEDAPLEIALDMPNGGALAYAGPPPDPAKVTIPPLPSLVHDTAFFRDIHGHGFHGGLLDGLAAFYGS